MDAAKLMSLMKAKKATFKKTEKTIKPQVGDNRFVILPGWRKGEEHVWFHDFGQHFVKDMAGALQAVYVCTDKTFGKPCAVCAGLSTAIRSAPDDETVNALKEANAGQGYLLNVLALDSSEPDTPQVLQLGKMAFANVVDIIENWGVGVFDATEPMIVTVNRSGKGLTTKYVVQISPKKHALPKGVLSKLTNLDEYVAQENEEGQRRAIGAINSVAGLLSAPAGADTPRLARPALKSVDAEAEDAALMEVEERGRAKAATRAKPAVVVDDVALDDELAALLGEAD